MSGWLYYSLILLLFASNLASVAANLFLLPGNWLMVAASACFAAWVHGSAGQRVSWGMILIMVVLAVLGEVAEFVAGAAGAARLGGSRRGVMLSMVGAMAGSLLGIGIGLPIPVLGSIVAAVAGGALGAFGGAYLGEHWKGRTHDERVAIGEGALWGRLGGTAAKLAVSGIMLVLVTWDSLF